MGRADHTQQVAESILRFFPGFEAFKLPPPSVSEEVMKNINRNKSQINSEFFSGIEKFKVLLKRTLTPKHSFNDGELVTGEGKGYYCIFVWLSSPVRATRNFSQISMYFSDENYWFWRKISRD